MPDPAGLLTDDEEERARRWQAGAGGLLSIGAGLMGYGADTRNPAPLMAGIAGFQDALRGAVADRQAAAREKYLRAQTEILTRKAQAEQAFADRLAGALKPGQPAQGDSTSGGGMDLTDQERNYLNQLPPGKEQVEGLRRIQEAKLIARQPPQGYRAQPDGSLAAIPGGPADPTIMAQAAEAKRRMDEKAIPTSVTKGIQENVTALQLIDQTIAEIQKRPDSIGGPGSTAASVIPGVAWWQDNSALTGDPEGTKVRSMVTAIGGKKLHDMSGAAVTVNEEKRLRGMIPSISDNSETAITKLNTLRQEYAKTLQGTIEYYNNPGSGFRPYPVQGQPDAQPQESQPQAPKIRRYNPQTGRIE